MLIGNPVTKGAIVADFMAQVRNPVWLAVLASPRWGSDVGFRPWTAQIVGPMGTATGTNFDAGNVNNTSGDYAHPMLGPTLAEPVPVWPAYEGTGGAPGDPATTNAFFILHSFALKLTRHRQAHGYLRCGEVGATPAHPPPIPFTTAPIAYLGTQLTSYRADSIIWFDPPNMPAPGALVVAADINAFLAALLASVNAIRGDGTLASDIVGCHSSCHSSCHASRGRR